MIGPITRGTVRTTVALGLRLVVQASTLLLVARMLGPHYFGLFAGIAAAAVILGAFATFGAHIALLRDVATQPARRSMVLAYAVPVTLLTGSALLGIFLTAALYAPQIAHVSIAVLGSIGIAELILQPLLSLCTSEHHGLGRIARSQLLEILPLALRLGVATAVTLLAPSDGLLVYSYGYLGASSLGLAIAVATLPTPWPKLKSWRLPRLSELRESGAYAALNITRFGPTEVDKALATRLLPLAAAGVYSASARVLGAITLPVLAMTLSALPRLFRDGRTQHHQLRRLLGWMFSIAFGYGVLASGALWLGAPTLEWLFGTGYDDIGQLARWLCLALPGMTLRQTVGAALMALGFPWMRAAFESGGVFILVVISILLTHHFGTVGMALSLAVAEWSMAVVGVLLLVCAGRNQRPAQEMSMSARNMTSQQNSQ